MITNVAEQKAHGKIARGGCELGPSQCLSSASVEVRSSEFGPKAVGFPTMVFRTARDFQCHGLFRSEAFALKSKLPRQPVAMLVLGTFWAPGAEGSLCYMHGSHSVLASVQRVSLIRQVACGGRFSFERAWRACLKCPGTKTPRGTAQGHGQSQAIRLNFEKLRDAATLRREASQRCAFLSFVKQVPLCSSVLFNAARLVTCCSACLGFPGYVASAWVWVSVTRNHAKCSSLRLLPAQPRTFVRVPEECAESIPRLTTTPATRHPHASADPKDKQLQPSGAN